MFSLLRISILLFLIPSSQANYELWFNTQTYQENFLFSGVVPIYKGMTSLGIPNNAHPDPKSLNSNTTTYPWAPYMLLLSFPNECLNSTFLKDKQSWVLTFLPNMIDEKFHMDWASANMVVWFIYQSPNTLWVNNRWLVSVGNN